MIEKFRNNVTFKKFIDDGRIFKKEDNSYYISYPEFIEYFKNIDEIKKHNLIIGVNFVYGWMPRTLKIHSDNFVNTLAILNKAKLGQQPVTEEDLDILKEILDHSLIGTSKLLHFINPEKFAIWDSKVYKYLTGEKIAHHYKTEKSKSYLAYLDFCKELIQRKEYDEVHEYICCEINYPMSKFRTAELIMFSTKNKESNA